MVRVYTDIENPKLTKFAKYMFFIEISVYFLTKQEEAIEELQPKLGETFDPINVYIQDTNAKDYSLSEELDETKVDKNFMYHVLVDTRNPRFEDSLSILKENNYFVDCYQCKDKDSNKAIIRMKTIVKTRIPIMVNSQYSKMYNQNEFDMILRNRALQARYTTWSNDGQNKIHSSLQVLMKTDDMLDDLVERLGITDDDIIKLMASREFDGKYDIAAESINSLNLN